MAIVLVALVAYSLGARGDSLLALVILGALPAHVLVVFITVRLFTPDVEPTGDFHGILYGSPAANASSEAFEYPGSDDEEPRTGAIDGAGQEMFSLARQHRTLEGTVLVVAAVGLALWLVWEAARPFIYRMAPRLEAIASGPPAFPVTVHIGELTIAFTNGSRDAWTCQATLGLRDAYASGSFAIAAQQRRELSYLDFRGADMHVESVMLREAAHRKIRISCADPSGRTYDWQFR